MAGAGLKEHDPYRGMETGSQGVRPEFLSGDAEGGSGSGAGGVGVGGAKNAGKNTRRMERDAANGDAAKNLSNAEQAATDAELNGGDGGLYSARKNENSAGGGLYRMNSTKAADDGKNVKGKFKGRFRKAGPITAIILSILGFGGILGGAQLFQPFSLIAQLQESFNSMHISAHSRSSRFIKWQFGGQVKDPIKGSVFGKAKFKITEKQKTELAKQGIEVVDDFDVNGRKQTVMKFDDGSGEIKVVTAGGDSVDISGKDPTTGKPYSSKTATFDSEFRTNAEFMRAYSAGSQTWRGQFAGWFGTNTNKFLTDNKITRNLWNDFKNKKEAAMNSGKTALEAGMETMKEKLKSRITNGEGGGVRRLVEKKEQVTTTDEDGNEVTETRTSIEPEDTSGSKNEATEEKVTKKLQDIKGSISAGVNVACAVADFVGVVNLMVAAEEALQIVTITSSYMEAVDKAKAGYSDESPINEIATTLNTPAKIDHQVIDSGSETATEGGESVTVKAVSRTENGTVKSAMQAAGIAALYGNGRVNASDPSAQSFNMTSSMNKILDGIGMGVDSFKACLMGRTGAAIASIGIDIATCLATACIGTLIKGVGKSIALALAIQAVITIITPWIVDVFTRDLLTDLAGEDLGNLIASGGNMYQGKVHRANGGSLSSRERYEEFAVAQAQVIAEEAKEERESLSPFDLTSKNTFMGAIMTQLMTFNTSSSVMSSLTAAGSVASSSLTSLMPRASAVAATIADNLPTMSEYEETCPYLASIGAIGDSYCNPYMVTDMDTMDDNPADVLDRLADPDGNGDLSDGNFEDAEASDGNVKIKQDSDLMKYIKYCDNRGSEFGVADQSFVQDFSPADTGNDIADAILGAAPILGDLQDIINSGAQGAGLGYISGASCVATKDDANADLGTDAPNWNTAKYYQRFIEDQSLAESMGLIDKSAVTAALEEYYEQNPLDDSYEGMLARWSGLSKETVSDVLDVIAYYNYVNEYDPSERYAFDGVEGEAEPRVVMFEHEYVMDGVGVALNGIIYADVRNRTVVV